MLLHVSQSPPDNRSCHSFDLYDTGSRNNYADQSSFALFFKQAVHMYTWSVFYRESENFNRTVCPQV